MPTIFKVSKICDYSTHFWLFLNGDEKSLSTDKRFVSTYLTPRIYALHKITTALKFMSYIN